ncbi:hypothetical protein E4K64_33425 [Bradyrhizobium frederickii]|uniref:Transmembrane protein n=1 Tax=Bradyrhizobium frederickii TaxID=2560054 RepID=A0A4Y9NNU9_9BRAD|nr:hypothetical protein [Bradyrhizobium frederickii]TFV69434.1 hypothetical protein E4K64_33425 [Bradyrhizobium frederickii]
MSTPQNPSQPEPALTRKELLDIQFRAAERAHDSAATFAKEANSAAVKAAEEAIKAMILINGGSSVAMLAFIGTLASKDLLSPAQLARVASPLFYFGSGVASAVIAAAFAYFTNLMIAGSSTRMSRSYDHPYLLDTPSSIKRRYFGEVFRYLGVVAALASIGCFIFGLYRAETAFQALAIPKQERVQQ